MTPQKFHILLALSAKLGAQDHMKHQIAKRDEGSIFGALELWPPSLTTNEVERLAILYAYRAGHAQAQQ